ncbi:hypothetical protein [Streptomyces sp. NPDC101166]|uniref:hypothetical protein n=1 Tax=Streptomyces sp. NPDC101166 TaxID=3366120 RepID=UPI0038280BC1
MAKLSNTFEGGSTGVGITTGNSGGTSGDAWSLVNLDSNTVEYDTARAAHGTVSARIATGATAGMPYLSWTSGISGTTLYARAYLYLTANPGSNLNAVRLMSGSTIVATVRINSTGKVGLLYASGSLTATSTASVPLNAWFRLELKAVASTTAGSVECRCYLGSPDATSATETLQGTGLNTGTNTAMDRVRVGLLTSTTSYSINVDDVAWGDTDWIGPATAGGSSTPLTLASSTWTAQALQRMKVRALGTATGTSAAQALARAKRQMLNPSASSEAAQALAGRKSQALGVAGAAGEARTLGSAKAWPLAPVSVTEQARSLGSAKSRPLAAAQAAGSAQAFTGRKVSPLVPAGASETAEQLTARGALGPASESDTSRPLAGVKTQLLALAAAVETAVPLTGRRTLALGPAHEAGTVLALAARKAKPLTLAAETAMAQPFASAYAGPDGDDIDVTVGAPFSRWAAALGAPHDSGWEVDAPW